MYQYPNVLYFIRKYSYISPSLSPSDVENTQLKPLRFTGVDRIYQIL